jgi:hypothetical protein
MFFRLVFAFCLIFLVLYQHVLLILINELSDLKLYRYGCRLVDSLS